MHFRHIFKLPRYFGIAEPTDPLALELAHDLGILGIELSFAEEEWRCISTLSCTAPPKVRELFEGIEDGSIIPAKDWEPHGLKDQSLQLNGPENHRAFVERAEQSIISQTKRAVSVMLWWAYQKRGHNLIGGVGRMQWSLDNAEWRGLPGVAGAAAVSVYSPYPISKMSMTTLETLLVDGHCEPLGHELLREAEELSYHCERSAFVLTVAAAEAGFKQFLADHIADARWIIENAPTPPVPRMLQELLPTLKTTNNFAGKVLPPPTETFRIIKTAFDIRNALVHKGAHAKTKERLSETKKAVRDLLYLLDYYSGHEWALARISEPVRRQLDT